jgi:hypothetical protein
MKIEKWREDYLEARPNESLVYPAPSESAKKSPKANGPNRSENSPYEWAHFGGRSTSPRVYCSILGFLEEQYTIVGPPCELYKRISSTSVTMSVLPLKAMSVPFPPLMTSVPAPP